jgi:phosphoglycolate phosphatase-like HAD superfamily hydrolase
VPIIKRTEFEKENREQDNLSDEVEFDAKGFVFDKDGTLISHDHFVPIMEKRVELFSKHYKFSDDDSKLFTRILGLDPDTRKIIPHGTMFIARPDTELLIGAFLEERGFRGLEVKTKIKELFLQADKEVDLEKFVRALPGISELLAELKKNGAFTAVATHDRTEAAINQLKIAKLDQYLDLIIGLDYEKNLLNKPSTSMLELACKKAGLRPNEAVVIGDSKNDVLMGIRGGAGLSIGVLSGEHSAKEFVEYDAIIDSVAEIKIIE